MEETKTLGRYWICEQAPSHFNSRGRHLNVLGLHFVGLGATLRYLSSLRKHVMLFSEFTTSPYYMH